LLNIGWSVAGVLVPVGLTMWITPRVVHGLGTDRYGLVVLAMTTIGFLSMLELGVTAAAVRDMARARAAPDPSEGRRIFATVLAFYGCVGACGALGLYLVGPALVGSVFKVPAGLEAEARSALALAAAGLFINLLCPPFNAFLRAAERFDVTSRVAIVTGALGSMGAWYFAIRGDVLGVLTAQLAASALSWAALAWAARRVDPQRIAWARPSWQVLRGMGRYASWAFVSQFFYSASQYSGRLAIAAALGTTNLAYFSLPLTLVQRIEQITGAASQFLFPRVVALGQDEMAVATLYRRACKIVIAVGLSICLPLAAAAHPLLLAWLGADFARASTSSLVILAAFFGFAVLGHANSGTLLGLGDSRTHALLQGTQAAIGLVLTLALGRWFGLPGVALAFCLSYASVGVGHRIVRRRLGPASGRGVVRGLALLPLAALPGALLAGVTAPLTVRFGVLGPLAAVGIGTAVTWAIIVLRPTWFLGEDGSLITELVDRVRRRWPLLR